MTTYILRSGETVTAKSSDWPTQYANRTQAQKAADKILGAEVIQRGRPFYVRLPDHVAFQAIQKELAELITPMEAEMLSEAGLI